VPHFHVPASTLAGNGRHSVVPCALVLEDSPVDGDSKLQFNSFPSEITEQYAVAQYKEIGGEKMSQPAFASYNGGNWGPFTLKLQFVAGEADPDIALLAERDIRTIQTHELDKMLTDMERKVRWCQALPFPLEKQGVGAAFSGRVLSRLNMSGADAAQVKTVSDALNNLKRFDPPVVLIVFGSWWVQRAYVTNVEVTWKGPWHPESVRPGSADVAIQFQPIKAAYPTWQNIRNQAGTYSAGANSQNALLRGVVEMTAERDAQRAQTNAATPSPSSVPGM
jgi:hypothetical protein